MIKIILMCKTGKNVIIGIISYSKKSLAQSFKVHLCSGSIVCDGSCTGVAGSAAEAS